MRRKTKWIDENVENGQTYCYKVRAVGYGYSSEISAASEEVIILIVSLDVPQNVRAVLDDNNFVIDVSWDAVKYAESYTIYRNGSQLAEGITGTHWTDESPLSGNNYYSVKAVGHGLTSNTSANSESVNYALAAPQNVTAELDDEEFVINVSWDAVKYAESYKVYRSSSSSGSYTLVADNVVTAFWQDTTPLKGNNYYRVYAVGHGQTSTYTTSNVVNWNCEMPSPQNVVAVKGDGQFTVNVSWDSVKYAEYYQVYRSNSATGTFTMVADQVTTNSWTDESAGYGSRYYKVCAVGHGLTSEMSAASEEVSIEYVVHPEYNVQVTVNGVSFTMIKVEAGTFQMGSTSGRDNEQPVHQVTLTNDYYIGETEVTQELWQAVMGSNPSYFKGSKLPVEQVSWNECQTFIAKLNELTGKNFRLPTEAEWEFAARGGNASQGYTYSGSNTVGDVAWYSSNSSSKTHEVATKAPNELGIYDMSGNVWEWCQDWYGSYNSEAQTNPTGPASGSSRVYRGGSWYNYDGYCRVACRYRATLPTYYYLGLRLAFSVPE